VREDRLDCRYILQVERDVEDARIIRDVFGDAEPRADDDPGNRALGRECNAFRCWRCSRRAYSR
jgi:hypothetical protein